MLQCASGFDARWHSAIEGKVDDHDTAIRGNGKPGLNERMTKIEEWREDEIQQRERFLQDRRENRRMNRAQLLALLVLIFMAVLNASGVFSRVPQFSTTTSTSTVDTTTRK